MLVSVVPWCKQSRAISPVRTQCLCRAPLMRQIHNSTTCAQHTDFNTIYSACAARRVSPRKHWPSVAVTHHRAAPSGRAPGKKVQPASLCDYSLAWRARRVRGACEGYVGDVARKGREKDADAADARETNNADTIRPHNDASNLHARSQRVARGAGCAARHAARRGTSKPWNGRGFVSIGTI